MDERALDVRGVSKRYGSRDALCGVDVIVERGQLHGLLGPNGAGKTTLMRVLLGLVRRDAGDVHLVGTKLDSLAERLPEGVAGFVETPSFYPYLSGRKNLELLSRLDGQPARQTRQQIDAVLEDVGLTGRADGRVADFEADRAGARDDVCQSGGTAGRAPPVAADESAGFCGHCDLSAADRRQRGGRR